MNLTIDTNVLIAANGRNTHAELACQRRCTEFLQCVVTRKIDAVVALDTLDLVLDEYTPYMNYQGQPGVGDLFFKFLHDHIYTGDRVVRVAITPIQDEGRSFEELPHNTLDSSDRKFLAIALLSGAEIVNALDTDWHEQKGLLENLGVVVRQTCPEHGCAV